MPEPYYIKTENQKRLFIEHLSLEQNQRLIFSSRFGNGKTTFLKNIFEKNTEYNSIHLYPINYSVASNEDIFELIKYDILFELLTKKIDLEKSSESFLAIARDMTLNNKGDILKILTPFLSMIPVIGDSVKESTERLIDFSKKLFDDIEEKKRGEYDFIVEYLEEFTNKKGSIYEENFYTRLICDLVDRFSVESAGGDKKKQTVLIIDDFDRIDPEHIFRLLNVFAAHQDIDSHTNKYGFDKVIVVCDIDNLRSVFYHKYGSSTDFNGYIDKFYSVDVFNYNMMSELSTEVEKLLTSTKGNKHLNELLWSNNSSTIVNDTIQWLLKHFVINDIINVRNVVKLLENKIILENYSIDIPNKRYFNTQFYGICLFNVLKSIFGDYKEVHVVLKKFALYHEMVMPPDAINDYILEYILLPLYCLNEDEVNVNILAEGYSEEFSFTLKLTKRLLDRKNIYATEILTGNGFDYDAVVSKTNIPELLLRTFDLVFSKGLLK